MLRGIFPPTGVPSLIEGDLPALRERGITTPRISWDV
jgi:hypothetical protein